MISRSMSSGWLGTIYPSPIVLLRISLSTLSFQLKMKWRKPSSSVYSNLLLAYCKSFGLAWLQRSPALRLYLYIDKLWAVYLIVLKKDGRRPRVYIGSATESTYGIRSRIGCYDRRTRNDCLYNGEPYFVDESMKDGFVVTHKGLLVWTFPSVSCSFKHLSFKWGDRKMGV
jgi:hypothetical protein